MKTRSLNKMALVATGVLALLMARVGFSSELPPTGTNVVSLQTIAPLPANLPPVPAEVLRMSEAGMSDNVITSYIQKSPNTYALDADQIIYLHDLGISSAVLDALVAHGQLNSSDQMAAASSGMETGHASSTEAPVTTTPATPPVSGAADTFYDSLAPYGTWVDVPSYGWCWQPTIVVVDSGWQPYCNNGCWLWTDQGWYWNSYYSWGWAPFHYGRWCRYPGYGWLWCPDRVWGPAWVCWRDYPGYCGWAPLPPGASFTAGLGWTFNGVDVSTDYGFGLGANCFTFCDYDHFCHRHPFDHFRHGRDADRFFHGSRVDNDVAMDPQHRFINRGIEPSRIEAATHAPIHQVAVRELPHGNGPFTAPDRLAGGRNSRVIYRPGQNSSMPRNPFLLGRNPDMADRRSGVTEPRGITGGRGMEPTSQFEPARLTHRQHFTPNISLSHYYQRGSSLPRGGIRNFPARRSLPTPTYHPDYFSSGHSAPVEPLHSWRPASSWPVPRGVSRPIPAFNGTHSWSGRTSFGGGMASGRRVHR